LAPEEFSFSLATMKLLFIAAIATLLGNFQLVAAETVIKDSTGMDCWVYAPDQIDPNTTYWLVVGVHDTKVKARVLVAISLGQNGAM
jgi:hypothetical protein